MKTIIRSLLDVDFYKFTMAQLAWLKHPDVRVKYAFKCRTKDARLPDLVDEAELREQLAAVRELGFAPDEIAFLRESRFIPKGLFKEGFLGFLRGLKLPEPEVIREDGGYRVSVEGPWPESIWWETLVLSLMAELAGESLTAQTGLGTYGLWDEGDHRLHRKIDVLEDHPDIRFVEFGTRRRFSWRWQREVVARMKMYLPGQLIGTSNVGLAREFDLRPVGTYAHECPMVYACLAGDDDAALRGAQIRVVEDLVELYGGKLPLYGLPDTFGAKSFFEDMPRELADKLAGFRQDSGDNFAETERAIAYCERVGIDSKTKTLFASDGLVVEDMVALVERFKSRIGLAFGWGTNLTNDVGLKTFSMVMKVAEAAGRPAVKLSNNPAKACGPQAEIDRYKRVFGYEAGESRECVY